MSDSLVIGGRTYNGVVGFKAINSNDNTLTYIRPNGNKNITENGNNINVTEYETVSVNVSGGIVPTGTINITENGTHDVTNYASANVNVSGGDSKNAQTVQQNNTRVASTTYVKACGDITVAKSGTYNVYWTCYRTSTSGTWGTYFYKNDTAQGNAQTTFSNYYQTVHLSNVSLAKNDVISVYARSRNTSYYAYVGQLTIIES